MKLIGKIASFLAGLNFTVGVLAGMYTEYPILAPLCFICATIMLALAWENRK